MGAAPSSPQPARRTTPARLLAAAACLALLLAACSDNGTPGGVKLAEARVSAKEKAATEAQAAFDKASAAFCSSTKTYIAAIDRYGKVFGSSAATIGDVKAAGADLVAPRQAVESGASAVLDAREALAKTKQELVDAQTSLAAAKAAESGSSTSAQPSTSTSTTTTAPLVPTATVDRVKKAEADLAAATQGTTDQTPLVQAGVQINAAAYALEVAWLRLLADAGCLTDAQQAQAEAAVRDYTVALQTALHTAGYYNGEIDGVYGPSTVDAVKSLQAAADLPVTGYVDRATASALSSALLSKGGAVATQAFAHTAAVQSTLKLAGYWTGPVDGQWTPELTEALQKFQTALGVTPTGAVDAATLGALQQTIANAKAASASTTTSTSPGASSTTSSPSSTTTTG